MSERYRIFVINVSRFETATQVLIRQYVGYNAVTSCSKLESFRMSTHQGAFTKPRLSTRLLLGIVLAANGTPDEFYYLGLAQEKQDKRDGARGALGQAIKLDPGHAAAPRQLAELRQRSHGQQGKQDEAAAEFRAEAANRKRIDEQRKALGLDVMQ